MPDAVTDTSHFSSLPIAFPTFCMESPVLCYREVFHQVNELAGVIINRAHVPGGRAQRFSAMSLK
jgi:hypothetical protein